jgi:hypothetical protein
MQVQRWQRYAAWSTLGDMALALPTLIFFAFILMVRPLAWWGYGLVVAIMLASAWFFGLALVRALTRVAWNQQALVVVQPGQAVRSFDWSALTAVRLRHFGSRRKHEAGRGRFELRLSFAASGQRLEVRTFDSYLGDFPQLAALVEAQAKKNRLTLDEAVWEGLAVMASGEEIEPSSLGEETGEEKGVEGDDKNEKS